MLKVACHPPCSCAMLLRKSARTLAYSCWFMLPLCGRCMVLLTWAGMPPGIWLGISIATAAESQAARWSAERIAELELLFLEPRLPGRVVRGWTGV